LKGRRKVEGLKVETLPSTIHHPNLVTSLPELLIVMPAYNEQASIRRVVEDWFREVERVVGNFVLCVIDDGSRDGTLAVLRSLQAEHGERLEVVSRENRGHGQTCMEGYRMAAAAGIPFVFQIDSDGQCDPCFFESIWEQREDYDVIYGKRKREDGFRRVVSSMILRWMLRVRAGVDCVDPNVPYRLMRTKVCAPAFAGIPQDFFLANVGLAVLLRRSPGIRHGAVPIDFRERIGGEPSVPLGKFAEKALELWRQLEEEKLGS